jgi:hypothetical protein
LCILERESILKQNAQGSLALLSCWLLLKVLEVEFLKILKVGQHLMIATGNKQL